MTTEQDDTTRLRIYQRDEHIVSRKDIDGDALKILRRLIRHGYKAYLVGGGVRDLLLKKAPKDFDIATDATPRNIKSLFRNCRIIGRRFKLAHIFFRGGKIIEVSTFRDFKEVSEEDGDEIEILSRDNIYGDEQSDALRRDLTINALFYNLEDFSIVDYVGGVEDLKGEVVRVIGDPLVRFTEDPVRMLRAIRHAARANFSIAPEVIKAIQESHHLIPHCPAMRLFEEIKKDLTCGHFRDILELLLKHELMAYFFPELLVYSELLSDKSSVISRTFGTLDELVREGVDVSATVALALLALFMDQEDPSNPELWHRFPSTEDVEDFSRESFTELAVPRRERERIAAAIWTWQKVVVIVEQKLRDKHLGRIAAKKDASLIADVLIRVAENTEEHECSGGLKDRSSLPENAELVRGLLKAGQSNARPSRGRKSSGSTSHKRSRGNRTRSRNRVLPGGGHD